MSVEDSLEKPVARSPYEQNRKKNKQRTYGIQVIDKH